MHLTKSEFCFIMVLVRKMIYKYSELLKKGIYNNDEKNKKAIADEKLFKTDFGLYSDKKINSKYENYIFNSDSAFFYHGLTDNIPSKYYIASKRGSQKIKNEDIVQTFMDDKYFEIGDTFIFYNNVKLRIYDKERMLIELVRNKNSISYDMYKEIVNNYRNIIDSLNLLKLQDYLSKFNDGEKYLKIIQEEVL